jgi:hypothetical protein
LQFVAIRCSYGNFVALNGNFVALNGNFVAATATLLQLRQLCCTQFEKTLQKLLKDLLIPYYIFQRDTVTRKTFVQQGKTGYSKFHKSSNKFKSSATKLP